MEVRNAMEDIGLHWNERKCATVHVKRGRLEDSGEMRMGEAGQINRLKDGVQYKFLGVLENIRQEDNLVLENAEKAYLKRLSVIWSSPLSDYNKILATNQFPLPAMTYLMWTQVWPIAELQRLDRESRKCMVENGAKHPLGSTELLYLPKRLGGRGLKALEAEYEATKIKTVINLYANRDSTIQLVRQFEKKAVRTGRRSLIKDAQNYASELDLELVLRYPDLVGRTKEGEKIEKKKIGGWIKKALVKVSLFVEQTTYGHQV